MIFLVNVNEEIKKSNYDMSNVWSPSNDGSGYPLITLMRIGDTVIQYYVRNGTRNFVCGVVVAEALEQYRPLVSDPRHNENGFSVLVNIQYRVQVNKHHHGMWNTLIGHCDGFNRSTYNMDAPFTLKSRNDFQFPGMTLRGYIWLVDNQLREMFTLMFPGIV